jgi:ubiquinone/menaquinone biosynthesis C-methylase UbiE
VDLVELKSRQQEQWTAGDFSMFATTIVIVSETLAENLELRAGQRVLDVAGGSGNTAIAAARRGCEVICSDFVPALLERGKIRAAAERLAIDFEYADAENLPYADESFDVVTSTFGCMFAPDQAAVARELLRVIKPGGKIGMANFPADSLAGGFFRSAARYQIPPRGVKPATNWGTKEWLEQTFGPYASNISIERKAVMLRYKSAQHWLDFFTEWFGPIGTVYEKLDPAKQERFGNDLKQLVTDANISGDETIVAPVYYSEVIITKSGA